MPIPEALRPLVRSRQFWNDFFWETKSRSYPELKGCVVKMPVAGGLGLSVSMDERFSEFGVDLVLPDRTVNIAFDDQAHWHPHVLRWDELEIIARVIALQDSSLPHPGVVLRLLQRFAPICDDDDLDVIVPSLECAWREVEDLTDREIVSQVERADRRGNGFEWRYDDSVGGWCLEQQGRDDASYHLYTLRRAERPKFPFEAWARMMLAARRTLTEIAARMPDQEHAVEFAATANPECIPRIAESLRSDGFDSLADCLGHNPPLERACWVMETILGLDCGTLLKRHRPRTWEPRKHQLLRLDIPLIDETRPLADPAGKVITDTLDGILSDRGLGSAYVEGGRYGAGPDGTLVQEETALGISLMGDLPLGFQIIREVLWWFRAPETARLHRNVKTEFPLNLHQRPAIAAATCLELARLKVNEFDGISKQSSVRIDRPPLGEDCIAAANAVLRDANAIGPDADGWWQAPLHDGGALEVCLGRADEIAKQNRIAIVIRRLTPEATQLIHQLACNTGLIILPLVVAARPEISRMVATSWPELIVLETAAELHDHLSRGPFESWKQMTP